MSPQPDHYNAEFLRRNNFAQPAQKQIVGRAAVTTPPSPAVAVSKPLPTIPVQTPAGGTIPATQPVVPTTPPVDETPEKTVTNPAPVETLTDTEGTPAEGEGAATPPEEASGTPETPADETPKEESDDSENKGEEGSEPPAEGTTNPSDDKGEETTAPAEEVKEEKPVKKATTSKAKAAAKPKAK